MDLVTKKLIQARIIVIKLKVKEAVAELDEIHNETIGSGIHGASEEAKWVLNEDFSEKLTELEIALEQEPLQY